MTTTKDHKGMHKKGLINVSCGHLKQTFQMSLDAPKCRKLLCFANVTGACTHAAILKCPTAFLARGTCKHVSTVGTVVISLSYKGPSNFFTLQLVGFTSAMDPSTPDELKYMPHGGVCRLTFVGAIHIGIRGQFVKGLWGLAA